MLLSACSAGDTKDAFDSGDFAPNQARYALPLDSYLVDPLREEWGRNVLVADCMKANDFTFPIPRYAEQVPSPTRNPLQRRLFTVALAEAYGYHPGPSKAPSGYDSRPATPAEEGAQRSCQEQVSKTVGASDEARGLIESLRAAAFQSARSSTAVRDAVPRWRECMKPLGLPDLPSDPRGIDIMPTESQRDAWGLSSTPGDSSRVVPPAGSPEEIRAAVVDARCRDSSGYAAAMYDAEVQAQLRLMADNQDGLERAKENADAVGHRIEKVLTERYG
jgi:hypothetical protein